MNTITCTELALVSGGTPVNATLFEDEASLSHFTDLKGESPNYVLAVGAFCLVYGLLQKFSPDADLQNITTIA